jgi:hypothetical protein
VDAYDGAGSARALFGTALIIGLLAWPAHAAAQEPPPCPPDKAYEVTLTSQEAGQDAPLVATHEVLVTAEFTGYATAISLTPQEGVAVLKKTSDGSGVILFAPTTSNLTMTVSWRQSADPSNPEETARCSATRVLSLPVLSANATRAVRQPGSRGAFVTFAVAPAVRRPNLAPLEISVRSTGHVRYPRANERLRTMVVPMRVAEQLKYRTHLPNLAYATTRQKCRFWWLTCGPAFTEVAQLNIDDRGRPDLDGDNAILRSLARTQPARWAAEWGIVVDARPGAAKNQPFGFDVQVRQAGRLLARVRRAGRCVDVRRQSGIFLLCKVARSSTLLR